MKSRLCLGRFTFRGTVAVRNFVLVDLRKKMNLYLVNTVFLSGENNIFGKIVGNTFSGFWKMI